MKFDDVISDIEKLVGLKLESIKEGHGITVTNVDRTNNRIELQTLTGGIRTRPFIELQKIWEDLCKSPAVHVDQVLNGSGSSRNQPETILANLPYIEWFKYNNKKHIALVNLPSHDYGTLKQMDEIKAEEMKQNIREGNITKNILQVIVVSNNIGIVAKNTQNITGIPVEPVEPGIYRQDYQGTVIILISQNNLKPGIETGTYLVIKGTEIPQESIPIKILGQTLYVVNKEGMQMMVTIS